MRAKQSPGLAERVEDAHAALDIVASFVAVPQVELVAHGNRERTTDRGGLRVLQGHHYGNCSKTTERIVILKLRKIKKT